MTHPNDYLGADWPLRDRWAAGELVNWAIVVRAGEDEVPPKHGSPPPTSTGYVAPGRSCDDPDKIEVPDTKRAELTHETLNRIADEKIGWDVVLKTHYRDNTGWPLYILQRARYFFWHFY